MTPELKAAFDAALARDPGLKAQLQQAIEARWLSRAETQGLTNPKTATYRRREAEFFIGAMTALTSVLPGEDDNLGCLVPAVWPIHLMCGRSITNEKDKR